MGFKSSSIEWVFHKCKYSDACDDDDLMVIKKMMVVLVVVVVIELSSWIPRKILIKS